MTEEKFDQQREVKEERIIETRKQAVAFFRSFQGYEVENTDKEKIKLRIEGDRTPGLDVERQCDPNYTACLIEFDGFNGKSRHEGKFEHDGRPKRKGLKKKYEEENYISLSCNPSEVDQWGKRIWVHMAALENKKLKGKGVFSKILEKMAQDLPPDFEICGEIANAGSRLVEIQRRLRKSEITRDEAEKEIMNFPCIWTQGLIKAGFNNILIVFDEVPLFGSEDVFFHASKDRESKEPKFQVQFYAVDNKAEGNA